MNPFEALSAFGEAAPILAKYGIEVQRIGLFSMIALGVKLKSAARSSATAFSEFGSAGSAS